MRHRLSRTLALAALAALAAGCSSEFIPLAPNLPPSAVPLGRVSGHACGMILPYAGAEQFLPIMIAGRMERAYDEALKSVQGATALRDVTIQDDYAWPILGLYVCTTISGEAVR